MAGKLKVITPQNLGKGIKYNNETKQQESPDEYEQLDGYEFPVANDTHYVEERTAKFRHIKTGYIHEAKKVELIPRGEPVAEKLKFSDSAYFFDNDRMVRNDNYRHQAGQPYYMNGLSIVGTSVHNGKSYIFEIGSVNVGQFATGKEFNEWAKTNFFKTQLVQNGGFSNTKPYPKVKDTEIQIPYPKVNYGIITQRFTPIVKNNGIDLGADNTDFDIQVRVKATVRNNRNNTTINVDTTVTIPHGRRSIDWGDVDSRLGNYNNQVVSYDITSVQPPKYQEFRFESTAVFTNGLRITGQYF